MESKTTSKTSCLKALLLKAWRERWTDLQWGVNIKTVLPRGVSGDVYNLADCILQQAVVGAGASQLVLSYLKHSLSAQLVSHAAVLQRLAKYTQFSKVHCVFSLLEFLEGMLPGVTCCGKPEETVLASAILSITSWLLSVILHSNAATGQQVKEKAVELLKKILEEDFYVAMLCLGRYNDPELYSEACHTCSELEKSPADNEECMTYVHKVLQLDLGTMQPPVESEPWPGSLIQNWLVVRLFRDPAASTSSLADQLKLFAHLKGYKDPRLYAELIRGSLMTLHDVSQTPHESQWGAFTIIKMPHMINELAGGPETVQAAIELLLQHSPLLDAMDAHSACSSLECLLGELQKARLLTDVQVKQFVEKRKAHPVPKLDAVAMTAGISKVIICAEPSLAGILKTLSSDYKMQDALLSMLHQVLAGKTFELILAVATVQGQLRALVAALIRFNECSKCAGMGDTGRAQLFDVSFLLLVAIVQTYGAEAVLPDPQGDSLFERWVRNCMVERCKPKAPDQLLSLGDPAVVEQLLRHFNSGDRELSGSTLTTLTWQDALFNMAGVMREVLVAWEQGALVPADVKRILEAVRSDTCCLPVAAAAWLCAHMRTSPHDALLKPVNMVQQLVAAPAFRDETLREPWQLTCDIIRKMQKEVQLPLHTKGASQLVSRHPATEQLHTAWTTAINRGWLDHRSARTLHCLLDTAGPRWLVSSVTSELTKLRYRDQLRRGVDAALAIFHVDMVGCTTELLAHVLPELLYNDMQADGLVDPQLSAVACLTSYCVYTAWDCMNEESDEPPPPKISREDDTPNDRLLISLRNLFNMLESSIQEGFVTQQTYFAFYLIRDMVQVKPTSSGNAALAAIPPALISGLLRTLPELWEYSILVNVHDVTTTLGKASMARDLCVLRNYHLRNNPVAAPTTPN